MIALAVIVVCVAAAAATRWAYRLGKRIGEWDSDAAASGHILSERAAMLAELETVVGIAEWLSGSEDFGPGGKAEEGWETARQKLDETRALIVFWRHHG